MTSDHRADDANHSVTIKGRYRVIGPGVASSGVITYVAEDVTNRRTVALSVLRADAAADTEFVTAVREQAYRLAKPACHHRALVRVHDTGTTDDGAPFVALEAVTGRSLRALLDERGSLAVHDGLRLAIDIGEGLETLHRSGIVYGELRPESVILVSDETGRDVVKLVGVELAAARRTPAGRRTRDDAVVAYLAPEQIARAETTEAADVYALGLLIAELLTGQRPDGARGASRLPPAIARIVAKALEEGPGRRYPSISLMVNDLWSAESEPLPQSSARLTAPKANAIAEHSAATRHRARKDVGLATALLVGLVLVGVTAWTVRADRLSRSVSSESEPIVAASPVASAPAPPVPVAPTPIAQPATVLAEPAPPVAASAPASEPVRSPVTPGREETVTAPAAKAATLGAVVRSSRVARQAERPRNAAQPATDGGDGIAIIDWLLKGGRSGG